MGISLRPSTFAAGGGLVDDADLTVSRARFEMNDYGGKAEKASCVLKLTLKDDEGGEYEQLYSTGTGFVPTEHPTDADKSGLELQAVEQKTAPSGSSNFALLINSVVNAGFPEDLLDSGSIAVLEGVKGHWNQVAQPKRANLPSRGGEGDSRPKTTLLLTTLIHLPGEGKAEVVAKGKPTGAVKQQAAATAPAPASDDLTTELAGLLLEVVGDGPGVKKVAIAPALFKLVPNDNPNKKALISMAGKAEVLSGFGEYGLTFDGTTLKTA